MARRNHVNWHHSEAPNELWIWLFCPFNYLFSCFCRLQLVNHVFQQTAVSYAVGIQIILNAIVECSCSRIENFIFRQKLKIIYSPIGSIDARQVLGVGLIVALVLDARLFVKDGVAVGSRGGLGMLRWRWLRRQQVLFLFHYHTAGVDYQPTADTHFI